MNYACGHGIGIVLLVAIFAVPDLIAFALGENAAYTGVNCFWIGRFPEKTWLLGLPLITIIVMKLYQAFELIRHQH